MRKVFLILSFIFLASLFFGASCVRVKVGKFDGGIFKSIDKGLTWEQKVALLSTTPGKTISAVNTAVLVFDPNDSNTLYLGTREDGLFVSYNSAESWLEIERLPKEKINAIAVDPKAKNIVYVGIGSRIFKSTDCCRSWQNIYIETVPNVEITSLAVDPLNNAKILAGLSDGRLLESNNGGYSWVKIFDFGSSLKQILINQKDPTNIYVLTAGRGIWRSKNSGLDWENLDQKLVKYPGARDAYQMLFDLSKSNSILISSSYGLLRSDDGGETWEEYKLLIQPKKAKIHAFALNPKNPLEIYFATANTFYRSFDGGKNWQTKSLPTKRAPKFILIDQNNPNIIYLGVEKIEKK
jgi:photosystem II stability/assembly factor-like uncharacterized protein